MAATSNGEYTLRAAAATERGILVYPDSNGKAAIAGLAAQPIGVTVDEAFNADEPVTVRPLTLGTFKVQAAGAITRGAIVYGRASGQVDDVSTSSAVAVGRALEAASGSGSLIEVASI